MDDISKVSTEVLRAELDRREKFPEKYQHMLGSVLPEEQRVEERRVKLKIVRLWDMFDGWIDIGQPCTEAVAKEVWNRHTNNGTKNTQYSDGDYYAIFDADTTMVVTPEYLGR